jgi:hypothetical protein
MAAALVLPGLLLVVAGLRAILRWPAGSSENTVLIGVLLLSLMPIVLSLLDVVIERGAAVGYGNLKIDFSKSRPMGSAGIMVPSNIGVRGKAVYDHETTQILDSLKRAATSEVVIIDLEEGQAWWETRLFVLLAGADRLKRPDRIVFVGKDRGTEQRFQGWSYASDLLPRLAKAHPQYERSLQATRAAARQWELVEPVDSVAAGAVPVPVQPAWPFGMLATRHTDWAFDASTGLRNELLAEQLLQDDLGLKVEAQAGPRSVSLTRLEELFRPVLIKECIDVRWPASRQTHAILETDAPYIALTEGGQYSRLVPRITLIAEVVKALVMGRGSA